MSIFYKYNNESYSINKIMSDSFSIRDFNHDWRSPTDFFRNTMNTTKLGLNWLRYFASKVYNMIPTKIKDSANVEILKTR